MNEIFYSRSGAQMSVPARIVTHGPHEIFMGPGRYCVHLQADNFRVFDCVFGYEHVMHAAVMDDFGNLVRVPS